MCDKATSLNYISMQHPVAICVQLTIATGFLSLTSYIASSFNEVLFSTDVKPLFSIRQRVPEDVLSEDPLRIQCSELFETCFQVIDQYQGSESGPPLVFRILKRKGVQGALFLSYARLLPPEPLTFDVIDTRTWNIDKTWVHLHYARMMITAPFFSGAVIYNPEDTELTHKALVLGLGGGIRVTSVDNDPVMTSIAKKWYQLEESSRHKVIIDDAMHYVKNEATKGSKYDVILVDVCYNKLTKLLCPIDEFLNDTVIEHMNTILEDHGAIIVNVIPSSGTSSYDEIKGVYSRHLPSCYLMKILASQILICSKIENNTWDTNRKRIVEIFEKVDDDFVFSIAQTAIAMTDNSTVTEIMD